MCALGPPWLDEYTGEHLPDELVEKSFESEFDSLKKFEVYEWVPEAEAQGPAVPSRWLIHRKTEDPGESQVPFGSTAVESWSSG